MATTSSKQHKQKNCHLKHDRKNRELHPVGPEHWAEHFKEDKYCYSACIKRIYFSVAEALVQLHTAMPTIQHAQAETGEEDLAGWENESVPFN